MVDIFRPDLPVARRRRLLIGRAVSFGVSRLQPAAPVVERASVWIDTVKRGPFARQVRGTGAVVPEEDLRWIPAVAEGRVERIRLHPGAAVAPDTIILELSNPTLERVDMAHRAEHLPGQLSAGQQRVVVDGTTAMPWPCGARLHPNESAVRQSVAVQIPEPRPYGQRGPTSYEVEDCSSRDRSGRCD